LVAYGDSFTQAFEFGPGDQPQQSWATGTDPAVDSILLRLRAIHPLAQGENAAVSGARMESLPKQVASTRDGATLVLIFLGINDACWHEPTPPALFETQAQAGFDAVSKAHPGADVVVYAIPDLARLGDLNADDPKAIEFRNAIDYCKPFWAPKDPVERALALARWDQLNDALRRQALEHGFFFSQATVWPDFAPDDLSPVDWFHPTRAGEARLAEAAWRDVQAKAR
jgi:lysophospholipase L1-like esterase